MQNKIHVFRAATMDEALDLVHRQLGQDFVIVDSKEVARRRLLPWPATEHEIELFAEESPGQQNLTKVFSPDKKMTPPARTIRSLAETRPVSEPLSKLLEPLPELLEEPSEPELPIAALGNSAVAPVPPSIPAKPVEQELSNFDFRKNLESLQTLITQLEKQSRPLGLLEVPNELFQHYNKLIDADVQEEIARELIAKVHRQSSEEMLKSPAAVMTVLTALVEREIRCAPPIRLQQGQRTIAALVGPTGVGKTTSLAKLAGNFLLKDGYRVGLITTDTCRVGAVEQLQSYADILGIPLSKAASPDEIRAAIDELDDVDLILIDTAGRNPFDRSQMKDLTGLVRASGAHHVLLTLSMASGPKMVCQVAEQFAVTAPTSLILTKLDETTSGGGLLSVAREIPLPVSYITTGLQVPDQIEPAHPTRLARLTLGRDRIPVESESAFDVS